VIKRLRIKNFESHEDTEIDFTDGLNVIVGESNAGKSSIVRALTLVAFNKFDPRSVRVGCDNCEIECETERGIVNVKRGKVNEWNVVTSSGKKKFKSIGNNVLSDAIDVLGMKRIKLGDLEINVNIMDQLEKHFMLSQFDGKSVSGSARAQIFDEISGLSGCEELVKLIGLDITRCNRKIKSLESSNKDLKEKLWGKKIIKNERDIVDKASEYLETIHRLDSDLRQMSFFQKCYDEHIIKYEQVKSEFETCPDLDSAISKIKEADQSSSIVVCMVEMQDEYLDISNKCNSISIEIKEQSVLNSICDFDKLEEDANMLEEMVRVFNKHSEVDVACDDMEADIEDFGNNITSLEEEKSTIMKDIKVCPLDGNPISDICKERLGL
jgi:exonuclease SbcC